jgi:hypothetical protein
MNIFVLDESIKKSAEYHVDRHVVKMPVEAAQMLCSAHNRLTPPYKPTHKNHPCSKWVRESLSNYFWLVEFSFALIDEYNYRYNNKSRKVTQVLEWCLNNFPDIEDRGLTEFAMAMPDQYKKNNVVEAYRDYYLCEKNHLFSWKNRECPDWVINR